MSQQQQNQRAPILCRGCGEEIKFHKDHKTEDGKWIRLNPDMTTTHKCDPKKGGLQKPQPQQQQASQLTIQSARLQTTATDPASI